MPNVFSQARERCCGLVLEGLPMFTDKFKSPSSVNGFYYPMDNIEWTTGFWTGQLWMAYEVTGNPILREAAERQVEDFFARIAEKKYVNHHDMGYLYSLSCVAAKRLTDSQMGRTGALLAADHLAGRFMEKGQFLQAWGDLGDKSQYRLIIDCLLNVPLLFWAAKTTGNARCEDIARAHINTTMDTVMREDGSTYHTYYFDPETGNPTHGCTHQGYSDSSVWARGQAWGVYGTALAYTLTKKEQYLHHWMRVTDFFLQKLPADGVPYWDMIFTDGSDEPRDTSAAAIAVCGILEMCQHAALPKGAAYKAQAEKILETLVRKYAASDGKSTNGLLLHGTYSKSSPHNTCADNGVDECTIWGDYFYLEALMRVCDPNWQPYWVE